MILSNVKRLAMKTADQLAVAALFLPTDHERSPYLKKLVGNVWVTS
jgi:hypothetical protein